MEVYIVQVEKYSYRSWRKQLGMAAFCHQREAEEWLNERIIKLCEEVYNYKQSKENDEMWEDEEGNVKFIINEVYEPGFIFWYDDNTNELYTIEKYVKAEQKAEEWYNVVAQITELR